MSRLIAVVACGFMLAACSATMPNLNLDFMKSAPQAETLALACLDYRRATTDHYIRDRTIGVSGYICDQCVTKCVAVLDRHGGFAPTVPSRWSRAG
jgi:hypothetical protein